MSQENVELVRAIFAARERGDFSDARWAHPATPVTLPPMMMHRHCIYNEAAASVEGVEAQGGSQIQRTETGSEGWVLVNNWLSIWPHLR